MKTNATPPVIAKCIGSMAVEPEVLILVVDAAAEEAAPDEPAIDAFEALADPETADDPVRTEAEPTAMEDGFATDDAPVAAATGHTVV